MGHTFAIILAGGRGLRLGNDVPKQFLPLGSKPVIAWSISSCEALDSVDNILVVTPGEFMGRVKEIVDAFGFHKVQKIIPGGATRQGSALNALRSVEYRDDDVLLFHDAARPFIAPAIIQNCILAAKQQGAAAVYVPSQDTVAEIKNGFVVSVPPRDRYYSAQTPQAFLYPVIKSAHLRAAETGFEGTDDVSLVLKDGHKVKMVEGEYRNFKITTNLDYKNACALAETI